MPRYVAAEGGRHGEHFEQRYDVGGKRVFPDQLSDGTPSTQFEQRVVLAQALIVGDVRRYHVGPPDQPESDPVELTEPRRRELLGAINETTGLMRFFRYSAWENPLPSLVVSLRELLAHPEIAGDAERQLKATALHGKTTRAHYGPSQEELDQARQPLLTLPAQLVLGLADSLPMPDLQKIAPIDAAVRDALIWASDLDHRRLIAELPAHRVTKLALGGSSSVFAGEYQTALDVADAINTLAVSIFQLPDGF